MTNYTAVNGQTLADICMNTYGSMDYFYKLLQDNNIADANFIPYSGQVYTWDETLVVNAQIQKTTSLGGVIYATNFSENLNTFYVIKNDAIGGNQSFSPIIIPPMGQTFQYEKTGATSYLSTSTIGETSITLIALQGKDIIQIEKNIQPLEQSEYSWNSATAVLTLANAIFDTEKLYIIYTEMITV